MEMEGGRKERERGRGWDSRQPVRVFVAGSVPEGVSRVLQDATFLAVSLSPLNFICLMLAFGWKILPCVGLYLNTVKAFLKDNPWGSVP